MRKYSFVIVSILLSFFLIEWLFADRDKPSLLLKPLFREGKSMIVVGKPTLFQKRWGIIDQSDFSTGHLFLFLENAFLEEVLEANILSPKEPLILRGRYHFFEGKSYLLPTHIHQKEDFEKKEGE